VEEGVTAPVDIGAEWKPRFGIYLTIGPDPKNRNRLMAVVTDGNAQAGDDPVTVLTLENNFPDRAAAKAWFDYVKLTRPWVTRQ